MNDFQMFTIKFSSHFLFSRVSCQNDQLELRCRGLSPTASVFPVEVFWSKVRALAKGRDKHQDNVPGEVKECLIVTAKEQTFAHTTSPTSDGNIHRKTSRQQFYSSVLINVLHQFKLARYLMMLHSHETINHITEAQASSLPTLKEPNIPWLVFKGSVNVVGNPPPVTGRQRWVTALQMPVPDPPNVARLKEEQLPSDHRHSIKVRLAGVGLEIRQITCSFPRANVKFLMRGIFIAVKC